MYLGQCMIKCHSKLDMMHDHDQLKKLEKLNKVMCENLIEFKEKNTTLGKFKKDHEPNFVELVDEKQKLHDVVASCIIEKNDFKSTISKLKVHD